MPKMIVVNESRYKELCSEFLKLSEKYKESLETITKLLKELDSKDKEIEIASTVKQSESD